MRRTRFLPSALAARFLPSRWAGARIWRLLDAQGEAGGQSVLAFAIRVGGAAVALVSQILMARWMGSTEYGIFVLVWVAALIIGNLSCLGLHTLVIRFLPQYLRDGRIAELRDLLAWTRRVVLTVSGLVALAGAAAALVLPTSWDPVYRTPFLLAMAAVPALARSDLLQGIARGQGAVVPALAPIYLARPLLILALLGAAMLAGIAANAQAAVAAAILASWLTLAAQGLQQRLQPGARIPVGTKRCAERRQWVRVTAPIFLVEGFFFLLSNADVLLVGFFLPPQEVAVYYAAAKCIAVAHFVYFAVKAGVAPRFAHLARGGTNGELAVLARRSAQWTFWPTLAIAVPLLAGGEFLLGLFGADFREGHLVMLLLAGGIVVRAALGPAETLLTMSGHHNACALVYGATLAIAVSLNILLVPAYGLPGAAIATSAGMAVEALLLGLTVWYRLGIVMPNLSAGAATSME